MDDETRHPIPADASFRLFQDHLIFYLNPVTNRPLFDNDPNNRGACYFMSGANVAYEFHCLNLIMQETGGTRPEAPIRTISEGLVASGLRDVAWGFINHQCPAQDVPSSLHDIQSARPDLYAGVVVPWVKYFITHLNPSNHLTTEGVLRVNVPEFESKMCDRLERNGVWSMRGLHYHLFDGPGPYRPIYNSENIDAVVDSLVNEDTIVGVLRITDGVMLHHALYACRTIPGFRTKLFEVRRYGLNNFVAPWEYSEVDILRTNVTTNHCDR